MLIIWSFILILLPLAVAKVKKVAEIIKINSTLHDNVRIIDVIDESWKYRPPPLSSTAVDDMIDRFLKTKLSSYQPSNPLLCVTFVDTHAGLMKQLSPKLISMNATCDWALLAYRGTRDIGIRNEKELMSMDLKGNKIVLFYYNMNRLMILDKYAELPESFFYEAKKLPKYRSSWSRRDMISAMLARGIFNHRFLPKPLLIMKLIPFARNYDYVWMFDGDIHVDGFDIPRLHTNLHCAFEHPPMVAQPLVYESTQIYWYFNSKSWNNKPGVIAHETSFVEVQTPIFNGLFLEFYLSKIVSRMLWSVNTLGLDLGLDNTFCTMATSYAKRRELALYKLRKNVTCVDDATEAMILSKSLTPCAVIVDGTPVHHRDLKVIAKLQDWKVRRFFFNESIDSFQFSFPMHFSEGHKNPETQPYGINSTLRESKSLIKDCKAPIFTNTIQ